MTIRAVYPRSGRLIAGAILCALLSGCGYEINTLGLSQKKDEEREAFQTASAASAWANPPGMTMVMQRGLLNGAEQRIGLKNTVPVAGDNILLLRTRFGHMGAGRLRFEEFMNRAGGAPSPFQNLSSGDLITAEDSLGTYFWAQESVGANITCVLAIRRLTTSDRGLPQDARVMDVMLRNCIVGTEAEALAPILDASIGYSTVAGTGTGGGTRMLSPLAAPGMK